MRKRWGVAVLVLAAVVFLGRTSAKADTFTFSGGSAIGGFSSSGGNGAVGAPIDTASDVDNSNSISTNATLTIGSGSLSITDTSLGLLATGTYSSSIFSNSGTGTGSFSANLDTGSLTLALLSALGASGSQPFQSGSFNIALTNVTSLGGGVFSGDVASSNVTITATPEPATLALLGTGLIGLAGIIRRKHKLGS